MAYETKITGIVDPKKFITYLFHFPTFYQEVDNPRAVKDLVLVRRKRSLDPWTSSRMSYVDALNMYHRKVRQGFEPISKHIH